MTEAGPIAGARALLRNTRHASLATLTDEGHPFVTLVAVATDRRGAPLMLLSDLARHTRHLKRSGRASLLLDGTAGQDDRLTGPRLTLTGEVAACGDPELPDRYLACHPEAALLLSMADFRVYRFEIEDGHQVAGFGRIDPIVRDDLLVAPELAESLGAAEASVIGHMMADHADAVALMAGGNADARIVAIDADGVSIAAGRHSWRVDFGERLSSPSLLRAAIVQIVRQIRSNSG